MAQLHVVRHGSGVPLVVMHGAGVDHREPEAALEAIVPSYGFERIYLDLPGMGRSSADGLTSNDDVVREVASFVSSLGTPVLVLGHSYGAYIARGVASSVASVRGLALICPIGAKTGEVPPHTVVQSDPDAYDALPSSMRAGFDEYFVVRTSATALRYRDHVEPGTSLVDESGLGAIFGNWEVAVGPFDGPTLIVAGRRDSTAGYADAVRLLADYPRATLAVLDDAGHALMHERPAALEALLGDWLVAGVGFEPT